MSASYQESGASAPLLELRRLSRSFSGRRVVDDVDLTVRDGERVAVFGPNGAGKTTLLRLAAGLLRPTSGTVRAAGADPRSHAEARARLGIVGHQTMMYGGLTAAENVELFGRLSGVRDSGETSARLLERLGARSVASSQLRTLSRGMQQRVTLARALVHSPSLLLADEPFTALDTGGREAVRRELKELSTRGGAVVLVSHDLDDGFSLATRAVIMLAGRIVLEATTDVMDRDAFAREYARITARAA